MNRVTKHIRHEYINTQTHHQPRTIRKKCVSVYACRLHLFHFENLTTWTSRIDYNCYHHHNTCCFSTSASILAFFLLFCSIIIFIPPLLFFPQLFTQLCWHHSARLHVDEWVFLVLLWKKVQGIHLKILCFTHQTKRFPCAGSVHGNTQNEWNMH